LAVDQFKTLANVSQADAAPARTRLLARQARSIVLNHDAQHLAIALR
jgi:hypothetical protein